MSSIRFLRAYKSDCARSHSRSAGFESSS